MDKFRRTRGREDTAEMLVNGVWYQVSTPAESLLQLQGATLTARAVANVIFGDPAYTICLDFEDGTIAARLFEVTENYRVTTYVLEEDVLVSEIVSLLSVVVVAEDMEDCGFVLKERGGSHGRRG